MRLRDAGDGRDEKPSGTPPGLHRSRWLLRSETQTTGGLLRRASCRSGVTGSFIRGRRADEHVFKPDAAGTGTLVRLDFLTSLICKIHRRDVAVEVSQMGRHLCSIWVMQ